MRTAAKRAAGGISLAGAVVLLRPGTRANKLVSRELDRASRRMRYLSGRLQGVSYRLRGQRPDPNVRDNLLADRVRSSLGGLEKRLDLPHVHVMVENHVVLLHGEVSSEAEAGDIERAAGEVSGVIGVESYLHIGLTSGDTRPSAGRAIHPPSDAYRHLIDAAVTAGIDQTVARTVVRSILATFADRLPANEREQVAGHLPADVRPLFTPPRRARHAAPPRTAHALVARIAATTGEIPEEKAAHVTATVIKALRLLVPEEARDVEAVLPAELRSVWEGDAAGRS